MIKKINLYVLAQVTKPLLITLAVSAMLLLLERMLRLFDLVVNQGGPFQVVWKMLGSLLPHYLGFAMPVGLFLGVLLAFRKLSLNSEIDAMQASGLSPRDMLRPIMALSGLLMLVSLVLTGYVQPFSRYVYRSLVFDLSSGAFGASIKSAKFNKLGHNLVLRIEESRDQGQKLIQIFLQKTRKDGRVTTITAREGSFLTTGDGKTILLRLIDGTVVDQDPRRSSPTVLKFGVHDWPIKLPLPLQFRGRGGEQYEMTLDELWRAIRSPADGVVDPNFRAALHGRIARAVSILILPLLGGALGFVSKRSGRSFGMAIGIVIMLAFQKILEFGGALAALGMLSPWLGVWVPVAVFAGFSGNLFYQSACRVGASPLSTLEDGWNTAVDTLRGLFRQPTSTA